MKEVIGKILLLLMFVLPFKLMGQSFNPDLIKMQADIEKDDYLSALSQKSVPVNNDEKAVYYMLLGKAEYGLGNIESSVKLFEVAEKFTPGIASIYLARSYKLLGNKPSLFKYLESHLKSDFKLPLKDIMLDPVFSDLDRDRDWIRFWSIDWYTESEKLQAEAEYRILKKDFEEDFWNDLILNHQNQAELLALQGQYHYLLNDNKKAVQSFKKALSLEPSNSYAQLKYADYLLEKNKYDEAEELYKKLIYNHPYDIKYYIFNARAIVSSGQSGRGVEAMNQLELMGVDATDLNLLIAKELIADNPEKALEYLDPILSTSPSKEAFNLRAQSLTEIGKTRDAISDYAMSLDLDPKQPDVYFSRAKLRLSIGDMEGACYDWKHAYELGHRDAADMLYKYCK